MKRVGRGQTWGGGEVVQILTSTCTTFRFFDNTGGGQQTLAKRDR